jgi:hypothetical protein
MRGEEHKHSLKTIRNNNNNKNATKFPSFSFSKLCSRESRRKTTTTTTLLRRQKQTKESG